MRVIVLGAGLIGTASAYYLQSLGHEVTVIDRQATPGAETSFANGGQISVSHAEPWANPGAPLKLLGWLGRQDAPLLFRLRADMRQWLWGLSFLRNCTPARTRHNIRQIVRLGTYSREALQQLRADTGIAYEQRTQGILHFYTNAREFEGALKPTEQMQALGCDRRLIDADEAVRLAPPIRPRMNRATPTFSRASWHALPRPRACSSAMATTSRRCAPRARVPPATSTMWRSPMPTAATSASRAMPMCWPWVRSARCWPSRWGCACPSIPPRATP
jgi:glycine/D-amino acid oxidase-like deaminating enzyme